MAKKEKTSKAEAIRETIKSLGGAEGIEDNTMVINAVKTSYGIDVTSNEVSMYKSKMKDGSSGSGAGRKGKSFTVDQIKAVQGLMKELDKKGLIALVEAIG